MLELAARFSETLYRGPLAHEKMPDVAGLGTLLTLAGLFLSESKVFTRKEDQHGLTK